MRWRVRAVARDSRRDIIFVYTNNELEMSSIGCSDSISDVLRRLYITHRLVSSAMRQNRHITLVETRQFRITRVWQATWIVMEQIPNYDRWYCFLLLVYDYFAGGNDSQIERDKSLDMKLREERRKCSSCLHPPQNILAYVDMRNYIGPYIAYDFKLHFLPPLRCFVPPPGPWTLG